MVLEFDTGSLQQVGNNDRLYIVSLTGRKDLKIKVKLGNVFGCSINVLHGSVLDAPLGQFGHQTIGILVRSPA